jgi:hypothetical protein
MGEGVLYRAAPEKVRFAIDSPVEEAGFEPSVPRDTPKFSTPAHVTCLTPCTRKSRREREPILRGRRPPPAEPMVRILSPPAVSQLLGCVGTRVPDDAASAGSGIDNQLGAGAEDAPLRHPGVSPNGVPSRPSGSVRQACGYLAHHGDRPPYSEPGEQLLPVATPKHPVRMGRGLKFGVASTLVHHQVRGKENIEIG